jgi:hypothetical protein
LAADWSTIRYQSTQEKGKIQIIGANNAPFRKKNKQKVKKK